MTKRCGGCGIVKPLTAFYRRSDNHNKHESQCKGCGAIRRNQWKKANPGKVRESGARWREANSGHRREGAHQWRVDNPDKSRAYYEANRDRILSVCAIYRKTHPTERRVAANIWRARKKRAGIFVIAPKDVRRLARGPCYLCGGESDQIDHIIPLARGGRHSIGNLAPACSQCNQRKHAQFLVEFKRRRTRAA